MTLIFVYVSYKLENISGLFFSVNFDKKKCNQLLNPSAFFRRYTFIYFEFLYATEMVHYNIPLW